MVNGTHSKPKNRTNVFKYSLITSAIIGMSATNISAQESQTTEQQSQGAVEEIEVKGTRGALINAQNMRREGETLLDALSASDIGALPDRSILEAIQRVPGVSIGRFAAPNDPDHFGTEGSGVVVRGLNQVRSEFNGRDTFTANSGRALSFEDIPPELIGSVEVFKSQTADMVEGGIAGTVNLITKKPFDNEGQRFLFSADATYSDLIEETTPSFFALYSNTYENDAGRFGMLFNFSNSKLEAQSDGAQVGQLDGTEQLIPRTMRVTRKKDDRERQGMAAVFQFENSDNTLDVTAEFIRSDSNLAWTENAIEFADDDAINAKVPAPGTTFEFDDNGVFQRGIISSDLGWRGDNDALNRLPGGNFGPQHAKISRARSEDATVQDISINAQYTPNDTWAFNFDIQRVEAETDIVDFQIQGASFITVGLDLTQGSVPRIDLFNPNYSADNPGPQNDHFTNPERTNWRSAMDHLSDNEGEQNTYRFDGKYTTDSGLFTSISAGARYAQREQTTRESIFNWGNISAPWAAGGLKWFSDVDAPGLTENVSFDNFARGGVLNIEGGSDILFPAISLAQNYEGAIDSLSAIVDPGHGGAWTPLGQRGGRVSENSPFLPGEINVTNETSTAFYIKGNFEGEIGGMDYDGNIGLRYVKIENETIGGVQFPDNIPDSPESPDNVLPPDQAAFGNNASTASTVDSEYTNVLPTFNLKLNLSDELLMRFGFSQSIALPQLGLLRNTVPIQTSDPVTVRDDMGVPISHTYTRYTANSGNPGLQPMEAYNYDVTLEWYFAEDSSLTGSLFYKDLSNYFIQGTQFRPFTNNGATIDVEVASATNGESGRLHGFELAYQQFYKTLPAPFDGLGTQMNYTYIDEKGSPNLEVAPDAPAGDAPRLSQFTETLPLEGLSQHNFNATLFYQKYGWDARLAYNWRSDYLLTTRDVITTLPIFSEAAGFLDFSAFYTINDNWSTGVQASNLTDTESVTRMQINAQGDQITRGVFVSDRRVSFLVRANF